MSFAEVVASQFLGQDWFIDQLEDIDVVKVIKVFSVETSKNDHTTSHKTSTVSSSWFWVFEWTSSHFQSLECVVRDINDKNIVEIVTKSSSKDVYFSVKDN